MYLVVLVFDLAGVAIVSAVHGSGNLIDAAHRIASEEPLYRIGLFCGLVGSLSTVALAVGLYVTVKPVDGNLALTAMLFRLVEAATGAVGGVLAFGTLQIYLAANHSSAFDARQLGALVDLTSSGSSTYVGAISFCVGSTIFFYLFFKSAYIPRFLAGWGVFSSLLYMLAFIVSLIFPRASGLLITVSSLPILIAEVSTALWLMIRGISTHRPLNASSDRRQE